MAQRNIIVVGGSAGAIECLTTMIPTFPVDLPATVFIVIHMAPQSPGYLADILSRLGRLPARYARDGEIFASAAIRLAPPDFHLFLEPPNVMRVVRGPRENRTRPAIDPLFRSAALAFGPRVIGVVLSGGLDDGTAGLRGIKMCGGTTVVQDPGDALVSSMPRSALLNVSIDHCVAAHELGPLLEALARTKIADQPVGDDKMTEKLKLEVEMAKGQGMVPVTALGEPSVFTCPECHGVLSRLQDENIVRYRCHTGHAYSVDALMASLTEKVEDYLYNAIRGIDETIFLLNHLGDHYAESNQPKLASLYFKKAKEAERRAAVVRRAVLAHEQLSSDTIEEQAKVESADQ